MELNAEQVKKALECCIVNDWNSTKCNECPIYNGGGGCIDELKEATLALINSQEQRIKELAEENAEVKANWQKLKESHENACEKCREEFKKLTEENESWQKSLITQKENADKAYYDLACEVENLRAENERLRAERDGNTEEKN